MIIFSYNFLQIVFFPIFVLIAVYRVLIRKETLHSLSQKLFCLFDFAKINNCEFLIHFSSIGELNSISFLIKNFKGKKIILSCSTLSSYSLAKKKYEDFDIIFLPLDFQWNVISFLSKVTIKKIIWIDSEIWPNWLIHSKKKNIKNILVNGRLSEKSYSRWKKFSSLSKELGKKYNLIFAKSINDKDKFETIFSKNVLYLGNLKFYQTLKFKSDKKNIICFASIHKNEFNQVAEIIELINKNDVHEVIIIPRHIHYSNELRKKFINSRSSKISILDKFGKNNEVYEKSKLVFMGGSLISHGGQNPIEPLSKGCMIISGRHINNFLEIYNELENLLLAKVSKNNDLKEIAYMIQEVFNNEKNNRLIIEEYFKTKTKNLDLLVSEIKKC